MLTERRRTVRKRYEAVQQRRALQDATNHGYTHPNTISSAAAAPGRSCPTPHLDRAQKLQLQQHIQQVGGTAALGLTGRQSLSMCVCLPACAAADTGSSAESTR